jgi:hypothetical protein
VAGIARQHEIGQGDDEIARLRVYLFKRLQAEVITVLLDTDAIELQRGLRGHARRKQRNEKSEGDREA